MNILVWTEGRHEKLGGAMSEVYPNGIARPIADHLRACGGMTTTIGLIDDEEQGLAPEVVATTDVLIWWGHMAHGEVRDDLVDRIQRRVLEDGMGLIVLHSGHYSKIFKRLMGTTGNLRWRDANEIERVWNVNPAHPIAQGLPPHFELREEMYGEFFDIPAPDELVFLSWFEGGEVFRSGCTWQRGLGRVFYFRPGHETCPTYQNPHVLRIIENAVRWAAPTRNAVRNTCVNASPLSPLR